MRSCGFWPFLMLGFLLLVEPAIADGPAAANRAIDKGGALLAKGKIDLAIAAFTEAIRLDPRNASAYCWRGRARERKGDHKGAIADCTQAVEFDLSLAKAYSVCAYAYNRCREYDEALADCSRAIRLDPNNSDAYHERGFAYANKGDLDGAIAAFTEAVRLDPKEPQRTKTGDVPTSAEAGSTRRSPILLRSSDSTPRGAVHVNLRLRIHQEEPVPIGRSPTSMRRSASIRPMRWPCSAGASPASGEAISTVQFRTTRRASGSTRSAPPCTSTAPPLTRARTTSTTRSPTLLR